MDGTTAIRDLHPLTPLTSDEILEAIAIVRGGIADGASAKIEVVELAEPAKSVVRSHSPGDAVVREAWVNAYHTNAKGVHRCRVSLTEGRVLSDRHFPEAEPMIAPAEFLEIEAAVKADPRFVAACERRGLGDMALVCVDPWSAGNFGVAEEQGRRVSHVFCWLRNSEFDHQYAHPIDGLNATVDIDTGEVLEVRDEGDIPVPRGEWNYDHRVQTVIRTDLRPINVVQPEGVSFQLDGHLLKWHDWELRIGFNAREGLTLHDISISGRPVLYRASIAEMMVPYGSPDGRHPRKNVFDVGEYGIGRLVNSLELGCDCLGAIQYIDATLNDRDGELETIKNAICLHEEDMGVMWKHHDFRLNTTETRRARRMVISTIATVGNYEYGYYWYLHLDGTIEFEIKATGVINTTACLPGAPGPYGVEVVPGVLGQIHQHTFSARLDMAVDGDANTVVECNTYADPPGPENPYGNAYRMIETVLETEQAAARKAEQATHRYWKFKSADKTGLTGNPTAYKLIPTSVVTPFLAPDGPSGRRGGYTFKDLWVTAFDPDQRFPAGEFVNGSDGSDGLPAFVAADRDLVGQDLVAWHTFGLHHVPRPEDFPVQPCITCGFKLMPVGFFDDSNVRDLPWTRNEASCHAS
ncbi:MAG: primary-amine oxidase [Rhodobacteraceae bacterium]|nr:primary-amine oxidase [Paracoccaceae bacterium]